MGQKEQKWNSGTNTVYYLYFVFSTKSFRKNFYKFHPSGCFRIFLLLAHLPKLTELSRRKTKQQKIKIRRGEYIGLHYTSGLRILKENLRSTGLVTSGGWRNNKRKQSLQNLLSLFDRLSLPPKFLGARPESTRQIIKTGTPYFNFHVCLPDN